MSVLRKVEKNTFAMDAIFGATCASNAVIAGAIEAWVQVMAARIGQEEWMETSNAEPMTAGRKTSHTRLSNCPQTRSQRLIRRLKACLSQSMFPSR